MKSDNVNVNEISFQNFSEVFPLKNKQEIVDFERSLRDDQKFKEFSSFICDMRGTDASSSFFKIAKFVFSDQVLSEHTILGTVDKASFKDYKRILTAHVQGMKLTKNTNFDTSFPNVINFYRAYIKNANGRIKSKMCKKNYIINAIFLKYFSCFNF